MGKEENYDYYDNFYKTRKYNKIEDEPWYKLWDKVFSELHKDERIIDYGCGSGQIANLILRNNMKYVIGIDFSPEAIKKAKEINKGHENLFIVGNLYDRSIYTKYDYDVALVSAGVNANVICYEMSKRLNRVFLDMGHA